MISKEMLSLGKNSSVIRDIFEYSLKRKAQIGAENVFDFSLGNPSIPTPDQVTQTMRQLLLEQDPVSLHGYTSASGAPAVKKTLADHINHRFGFPALPELIYMTCGAAASLSITLKAICNSGDEVILLAPYFPEYSVFVKNADAVPKVVPCRSDDFRPDPQAIAAALNANTRAIILNSPNNPSGVVLSIEDIKVLATLLNEHFKETGNRVTVIADEPYRELVYNGIDVPYIPCYYPNTVVCYSYSKSLSLPGERIGYIMVSPQMEAASDVYAAICGAGRAMGYVCAPSLLQYTVAACDGLAPELGTYSKNRDLLYEGLTQIGYEAVHPEGAFYLFLKALEPDAYAFCEKAKKYELLLVPSDDFGVTGYVRIAYCVTTEQIRRSLPAFRKLFEEYTKENKK